MLYTDDTISLWQDGFVAPSVKPLERDVLCDVCVVGAGIAGLTTAHLLAQEGRRVVVVDDGEVGSGATLRTSGHLTCSVDQHLSLLEESFGKTGAQLAAQSHLAAIDAIESIAQDEGIDCDFARVAGYLAAGQPDHEALLKRERSAYARAGVEVSMESVPLGAFDFGCGLRFPRQAQFHVGRYLSGLANTLLREGVALHTHTRAVDIVGQCPRVKTSRGPSVHATEVVVATNEPFLERHAKYLRQRAYRTYVIALALPKEAMPALLLSDTLQPYHYVRTVPGHDHDWLVVGGEDHISGASPARDPFSALEDWARTRFPYTGPTRYRWSGPVVEPSDGLAFIGRVPDDDRVFVITGDSGSGLTHGTLAGLLIADLIARRPNPWASIYDPYRRSLRGRPRVV